MSSENKSLTDPMEDDMEGEREREMEIYMEKVCSFIFHSSFRFPDLTYVDGSDGSVVNKLVQRVGSFK